MIKAFKQEGLKIATIKHDAHTFEIDHEGKDTWKYAESGSDIILINSREKLAWIEKLEVPVTFEQVVLKIDQVDIIFVEGYKYEFPPKILVVRRETDLALLSKLKDVVAIATLLPHEMIDRRIPVFGLDDYLGIVEFIRSHILGEKKYGTRT